MLGGLSVKIKKLDELLESTLFEQEPEKDEEDVEKKDIEDIEKKDLGGEDGEDEEKPDEEDVVVAIKFDDNAEGGGQIKLIDRKKLSSINSIESILKLFKIDPDKVPAGFKDKIEITINSPLSDFKEEEYIVTLMDKIGQIAVRRSDFKTTITKKSAGGGNLGQEVQQSVGAGEEEIEKPTEKEVDLSYLPELEVEFTKAVKNEFFDRVLGRR